jgi:FlaG/FlaF family flagellin (archaellin)
LKKQGRKDGGTAAMKVASLIVGLIVMVSAALLLADVIISYVDPSSQLFSLGT